MSVELALHADAANTSVAYRAEQAVFALGAVVGGNEGADTRVGIADPHVASRPRDL